MMLSTPCLVLHSKWLVYQCYTRAAPDLAPHSCMGYGKRGRGDWSGIFLGHWQCAELALPVRSLWRWRPALMLQLTPLQRANAHLAVARGLYHTYLLLLRTQGLVSKNHPIEEEAVRPFSWKICCQVPLGFLWLNDDWVTKCANGSLYMTQICFDSKAIPPLCAQAVR